MPIQPSSDAPLEAHFRNVCSIILSRQDCITGLLPASTAVNGHGNYTDAWVRDNVYSILSVWGLALAYRRVDGSKERVYLLEQSVVKLMRGLLTAMLRQSAKVERFKHTQHPLDALHAKYKTGTGEVVVGDQEWGHLQLDATSLFLLMLAQMTASGLRIIFTLDEVNFVQNLVHYISRAYRTPDYGIWERGNKMNHGLAELNASSVGMAKAALEAMAGCRLFGESGGQASVVHVVPDDIARTRIALESLLPRESFSKEVDAALLSITGFPAFAVDDNGVRTKTEARIVEKLQGRFGCKRFLLDGHQAANEDPHRLHYEPHELKQFQHIECEWPLFFTYLLLNHLFAGRTEEASEYRKRLETLLVDRDGARLLPELYVVPASLIAAEQRTPGSQEREPNQNVPLVWAQSLYILGCLLQDGLLQASDIDPIGRHRARQGFVDRRVRVALLADDERVRERLREHDVLAQTLTQVAPIQVRDAGELAVAYTQVGRNDRLGLTGRPLRQLRSLSTSRFYQLAGELLVFLPQFMNQRGFYLALDNRLLIQRLRAELSYIARHWDNERPPLLAIRIRSNMLEVDAQALLEFIGELRAGGSSGAAVEVGILADFVNIASRETIDYLHDFRFSDSLWSPVERRCSAALLSDEPATLNSLDPGQSMEWENADDGRLMDCLRQERGLAGQTTILQILHKRHGPGFQTNLRANHGGTCCVGELLEEVYERAGNQHAWSIVRRCAGLLGKYDIDLEQSTTEILVRQHALTVGRSYSDKATLVRPADSSEILEAIRTFNPDDVSQQVIVQELIIYLGMLIKTHPEWFEDMHTLRVGHILQLMIARRKRECSLSLDQIYSELCNLPPHALLGLLRETLADYDTSANELGHAETLHFEGPQRELGTGRFRRSLDPADLGSARDWQEWREHRGSVGRESEAFFAGVWLILERSHGLMIGDKMNSERRLDSDAIRSQMTSGEQTFKRLVQHLLNKIQAPVYRQLTVEALRALASMLRDNPDLRIDDTVVTDILIGHAVRLSWLEQHPENRDGYHEVVSQAWEAFYLEPPHAVANAIMDALVHLMGES
ncbi:glycoside hydrolase family 15 protein [Methylotetracoccus oryzae]|uniref:glycoside hydrolase family 15 protein n=1 Tax=Methylotetracoccus oryzae TaxID=1919059 RepID=UPI00111A7BCB|nr:glycoside hydrolase family 15 protein [Methylotetracoccus oryzae]